MSITDYDETVHELTGKGKKNNHSQFPVYRRRLKMFSEKSCINIYTDSIYAFSIQD
jgi:hypothetical protein